MEPWEVILRERLDQEIQEGLYSITVDGKKMLTGKYGVIDQMVDLARESLDSKNK